MTLAVRAIERRRDTLLVWASDQAHVAPDFLAVIDFDRDSPTYGKVLRTVPLSGANAVGNEPHHVGLSRDGRTLALGGLLSVLRGQDQVFFFDVTDPRNPTFIRSDNPPDASITDEFAPLEQRRLSRDVHGRRERRATRDGWSSTTPARSSCRRGPRRLPTDGFNPHGISIDEAHNLMVTSDFICPLRTLHVHGGDAADLRGSVRVWDLARREITRTIVVGDPAQSGRDDGSPVDSARSPPARVHGGHGRQQAVSRRYAGRHGDGRVRLRCLLDRRTCRRCRSSCA